MSTQYKLINPYIKGTFDNNFEGDSADEVALKCWNKLSSHFANNVPKFGFTLQRVSDGKLSHYKVTEGKKGKTVEYVIKKATVDKKDEETLEKQVKDIEDNKMKGGKRRKHHRHLNDDDDDSSSSSSYDIYKYGKYSYKYPISWFWYNPQLYRYPSVYIPSFNIPSTVSSSWYPYVEVQLANVYYW